MKKILPIALSICMILCGCGSKDAESVDNDTASENTTTASASTSSDAVLTASEMFTDRDCEVGYDEENSITIKLNGSSATASDDSVKISGSTVTITEDMTHIISGTLTDGMIIVDADSTAKLQIVLNGVNITSSTSAALYIIEADKVFVTLADGSENTLANGGSFTAIDDNNIDAALFSRQDITFNGKGSLTVTSPAGHGIVSKDDLVFTSGTYTVNSASHGLDANDSVRIANADITIDAGKDGIHAENTDDTLLGFLYAASGKISIEAEGDGISTASYIICDGGTFDITAGGGSENGTKSSSESYGGFMGGGRPGEPGGRSSQTTTANDESSTGMKGIKATGDLTINEGSFTINSADDSVHSNATITVNGGTFEIASGDDGFHADDALTITSCTVNISECYEGLEAVDIKISGGDIKLVATDDGINAAGGTDQSGTAGGRDAMFGGMGGMGGGGMSSSNGSVEISGGTLYINSSGDGIDANGTLTISGGYTTVVGPTSGDTATLDYDVSGIITGGTFIGTGASNMAQTFSSSEQGVVAASVSNQSAGTTVTLKDSNGNELFSYAPELSFQVIILSSPELVSGETYTVTAGSISGDIEAD